MARCCLLQNPLTCFKALRLPVWCSCATQRCRRACGMAETEWSWLPGGLSSQPVAYWREKPGKFPLAGFPGTLPKCTRAPSFREGAAWPSGAGVRGPTIQSQHFLSFALWFGPCHFPALGRHQPRWCLHGPFQIWHPTHLGWVSWRTNLKSDIHLPFPDPKQ